MMLLFFTHVPQNRPEFQVIPTPTEISFTIITVAIVTQRKITNPLTVVKKTLTQ